MCMRRESERRTNKKKIQNERNGERNGERTGERTAERMHFLSSYTHTLFSILILQLLIS